MVKGFADAPRTALFFHVVLQITARHVQADGVAEDVFRSVGGGDIFSTFADGHDQFNLVVQIAGLAGVGAVGGFTGFGHQHGIGWLQKEEGRFAACESHFFGVFFVIAAHAVDPVNGEAFGAAQNGHGHGG